MNNIGENPVRTGNRAELYLKILLRYLGTVSMLALGAVFMPFSWMDATHTLLGMGSLSTQPVTGYLARTVSLFYAMLGALLWFLSFNPRYYCSFVRFFGMVFLIFGLIQTWIDFHQKMPDFWKYSEGPIVIVFGVLISWLSAAVNSQGLRGEPVVTKEASRQ